MASAAVASGHWEMLWLRAAERRAWINNTFTASQIRLTDHETPGKEARSKEGVREGREGEEENRRERGSIKLGKNDGIRVSRLWIQLCCFVAIGL